MPWRRWSRGWANDTPKDRNDNRWRALSSRHRNPPGDHIAVVGGDWIASAHAAGLRRDLDTGRCLPALVLAHVDSAHDVDDHSLIDPGSSDGIDVQMPLHVRFHDFVQHLVGRQRVAVLLVRPQLGAWRLGEGRLRDDLAMA